MATDAPAHERRPTQSVDRACLLLGYLARQAGEVSLTELARELGVHKSTASRLLLPLAAAGLVERDSLTGRYRLGLGVVAMSGSVMRQLAILRIADPPLRRLAELTQETVNLGIRYRDDILNIAQIPGAQLDQSIGWLGHRAPLHLGSGARALLAHLHDPEIDAYLAAVNARGAGLDRARLWDAVREIRQRGYAVNRGELHPDVFAVGAPIHDEAGRSCASVSLAGHRRDFTEPRLPELARIVVRTAQTVSRQLGFCADRLAQFA